MERKTGFGPTDRASSPAAIYTDAARAPALRLDLAPRFTLAAAPAFAAELALEAGARVDGWIVEGSPDRNRTRAYALVGARAAIPLERRFGSVLHRVEPAFEPGSGGRRVGEESG